jgi:hypothetical protein
VSKALRIGVAVAGVLTAILKVLTSTPGKP